MPEHAVWCELAVAERKERRRSTTSLASNNLSHALAHALDSLEELELDDRGIVEARAKDSKHWLQETSIARHAAAACATAETTVVDCCAGRGALSERVADAVDALRGTQPRYVLLDRAAFKGRRCASKRLAYRGARCERVVEDLARAPFEGFGRRLVCVAKHSCGPAADLILGRAPAGTPLYVATCCHHLCTWAAYAGRGAWAARALDRRDFEHAVRLSAWATLDDADHGGAAPAGGGENRDEMKALGARCKRLLDACRVDDLGGSARLLRYTSASVENRLIVAAAFPD